MMLMMAKKEGPKGWIKRFRGTLTNKRTTRAEQMEAVRGEKEWESRGIWIMAGNVILILSAYA
jgi:hypothetical protein